MKNKLTTLILQQSTEIQSLSEGYAINKNDGGFSSDTTKLIKKGESDGYKFIGELGKGVQYWILFELNAYDKKLYKDVKLKSGTRLVRYAHRDTYDYMLPVCGFNESKGFLYFMDDEKSQEDIVELVNTSLKLVVSSIFISSSFILDSTLRNSKDVLEHLNANLMLTGKVQRIDGSLIVNCQLTDTENNTQIWGDKVAHKSDDILELEKQMVTSLMNKLPKKFKSDQAVSKSWSENSEAQVHYMKGKALSYGSTKEEEDLALNHFREAIKLDNEFVAAYVAIANEQQVQAMFATDTRAAIFNEARLAVQTALNLNPNYGEAYTVDAAIKFYQDRDWEGAEASYEKAIRLDPNNANALIRYSFFLTTFKRHQEALIMANKAIELDPISISSLHNLGWSNLVAGNYAKAEKAFSDAIEIHPDWAWGYIKRAYSLMYQNKYDLALKDQHKARELIGDWGSELLEACFIYIFAIKHS